MVCHSSSSSGVVNPPHQHVKLKHSRSQDHNATAHLKSKSQNLNSQNFVSHKSSKPKSPHTNNKASKPAPLIAHRQSTSPQTQRQSQPSNPRPQGQSNSPRPLLQRQVSSPRPVPQGGRRRNLSSCSSTSSMSTSPSSPRNSPTSFRVSPSRSSPNSFASSTCYQAPTPASLPLPPIQWTCREAPQDPTAQLKLLLNVQAWRDMNDETKGITTPTGISAYIQLSSHPSPLQLNS